MPYNAPVRTTVYSDKKPKKSVCTLINDTLVTLHLHTGESVHLHSLSTHHTALIHGYYYYYFKALPSELCITKKQINSYIIAYATPADHHAYTRGSRERLDKAVIFKLLHLFHRETLGVYDLKSVHTAMLVSDAASIAHHDTTVETALYKAAGAWLLDSTRDAPVFLLTTGVITPLVINYAEKLGVSWVITRQVPTQAAYTQAKLATIGLIGLARLHQFSVFFDKACVI